MKSTVAKVAVYIYLYSVLEMYVKQYTVLTGTSKCQLLFLKGGTLLTNFNITYSTIAACCQFNDTDLVVCE